MDVSTALVCTAVQQHPLQSAPHARGLSVAKEPPARNAGAAPQLSRQHRLGDAGLRHEQDTGEHCPVIDERAAALEVRRMLRQQWAHDLPQLVIDQPLHDLDGGKPPALFGNAL